MSVISYLESRANVAVLSLAEKSSIDTSISTIRTRLMSYFGADVSEQLRFGSSTRNTILPRSMDDHSDIDYMVVFAEDRYAPQTYLDRLKRFAEFHYRSSDIKQSSPTVVLQLNHIKFDLVPALKQSWWFTGYRIPNVGATGWQDTDPNDFNSKLDSANQRELYKLKPMIRLFKYWNACNGYVYDSYDIEKYVVALSYSGVLNLRDYLFTVFDNLSHSWGEAQWRRERLARAKEIVAKVRQYERNGMPASAEVEVKKLIPA